jgi:hypothetical protein
MTLSARPPPCKKSSACWSLHPRFVPSMLQRRRLTGQAPEFRLHAVDTRLSKRRYGFGCKAAERKKPQPRPRTHGSGVSDYSKLAAIGCLHRPRVRRRRGVGVAEQFPARARDGADSFQSALTVRPGRAQREGGDESDTRRRHRDAAIVAISPGDASRRRTVLKTLRVRRLVHLRGIVPKIGLKITVAKTRAAGISRWFTWRTRE